MSCSSPLSSEALTMVKEASLCLIIAFAVVSCAFAGRVLDEHPAAPPVKAPLPVDQLPMPTKPIVNSLVVPSVATSSRTTTTVASSPSTPETCRRPPRPSTTTIIVEVLSEGHELGAAVVGSAQGFHVAISRDGASKIVDRAACSAVAKCTATRSVSSGYTGWQRRHPTSPSLGVSL